MFHNFRISKDFRLAPGVNPSYSPPPVIANLLAYFSMNETSGTRYDSTSNGYDLTVVEGSAVPSDVGLIQKAADFSDYPSNNGILGMITPPAAIDALTTGDFSYTCWVKLYSVTPLGNETIFFKGAGTTGNSEYDLRLSGTPIGSFEARFYANSSFFDADSGIVPTQNQWHFVVMTHDVSAKEFGVSVDGGSLTTNTYTGSPNTSGKPLYLGFTGGYWNGLIDEVAIWDKVLSPSEITSLYNGGSGKAWPNIP